MDLLSKVLGTRYHEREPPATAAGLVTTIGPFKLKRKPQSFADLRKLAFTAPLYFETTR